MLGLVLTAGGARGAYQAGVLKRVSELPALADMPLPFPIVAGASAGAINGAALAARAADFRTAAARLADIWADLRVEQVFRTDALALVRAGAELVFDMVLGGLVGAGRVSSLFDASPLRGLLTRSIPVAGIDAAIRDRHLHALAIAATSYHSGRSFIFIHGQPGHAQWVRRRRVTVSGPITIDHICASAAIPVVFQPVPLDYEGRTVYFGDGGLRLVNPFSPAIRLGADRIFAVGIRSQRAADNLADAELGVAEASVVRPPLAQICGVFMNAVFLDHLDADLDHLLRMNDLLRARGLPSANPHDPGGPLMRLVTPFVVSPSEDLAIVAQQLAHRMPRVVRYLLDGLGTPDAQSADLMSYLLFDNAYTRALIDIGYADAGARIAEIEAFLALDDHAKVSRAS